MLYLLVTFVTCAVDLESETAGAGMRFHMLAAPEPSSHQEVGPNEGKLASWISSVGSGLAALRDMRAKKHMYRRTLWL